MASIQTKTGLDAIRAYDPTQRYSGLMGVASLLGHCILEVVYKRAYEPRKVVDTRRRYARVRLPNGKYATTTANSSVWRTEYRDRSPRSMLDRDPPKDWYGANRRRMLITLDFRMLRHWGSALFGFPKSIPNKTFGGMNEKDDIMVVWDCLWQDWRRVKLSEPLTVVTIIPTSVFPNCLRMKTCPMEYMWMLHAQRRVASSVFTANFVDSNGMFNKQRPFYLYLDNYTTSLNLQAQEEELRLKEFEARNRMVEEEKKRREAAEKAEQEKKRQMEEAQKKAAEQKAAQEAARKKAAEEAARKKAQQQMEQQQAQRNAQQQQQQSEQQQNSIEADKNRPKPTNIEKPGNVEVEDGTGKRVEVEYSNVTNTMVKKEPTFDGGDQNSIPVNGVVDENGVRKDSRNA